MNPNGQTDGESRLDRLERLFEQYAERNEKEHKLLLTAQVLMVDTMTKLETSIIQIVDTMTKLETRVIEMVGEITKLEIKVIEIGDKLDGLIGVVGGLIKKRG